MPQALLEWNQRSRVQTRRRNTFTLHVDTKPGNDSEFAHAYAFKCF